jgi:lysozyme family protein
MPTLNEMRDGYKNLWSSMKITRNSQVEKAAKKIIQNKSRYQAIEAAVGTPWWMIGALHMRESNNDFRGVLHNGEHIIGTKRRTRLVPAGRGPFATWEEAAIDALKLKKHHLIKDWSIEQVLYSSEQFNGWGYLNKGINSPYMWAGSNHYTRGKYVADHVFSGSHVDTQLGVAPVMKRVLELQGDAGPVLKQESRRYRFADRFNSFWKWLGLGGIFSFSTLETVRDFCQDYWAAILLVVGFAVFIAFKYIQYLSRKEYKEGRYQPSGGFFDVPAPKKKGK